MRFSPVGLGERRHLVRAVFARAADRPQYRQQQGGTAEPEAVADRVGHARQRIARHADTRKHERKDRAGDCARADERGLERIAGGVLILAEHVADERAERLHRDVDRGVEHPERQRGEPQHLRLGHHEQRQRGEYRTREEIRAATAEAGPGAVAVMADDRLDEQPGQRCRDPQIGEVVERSAERLEDPAHVGVLQREADLDAEKAEADIPQAGKALDWFLGQNAALLIGRHLSAWRSDGPA